MQQTVQLQVETLWCVCVITILQSLIWNNLHAGAISMPRVISVLQTQTGSVARLNNTIIFLIGED